jgi:2-succinyl-6-hydroxy-2,4-cyclohexadiene-1-carboxylate synthase
VSRMRLYCLHGFLGRPDDWSSVFPANWNVQDFSIDSVAVDLFNPDIGALSSLDVWGQRFNKYVYEQTKTDDTQRVVLGYSLGGRLALHALLERPRLWDAAIIVSAHSGLKNPLERKARLTHDEAWARRFESDGWESVISDWNQQPVFSGRTAFVNRVEGDYERAHLCHALRAWSLGHQRDLLPELATVSVPLLWIVGAEDAKFVDVAANVAAQASRTHVQNIAGAGHRVPWEATGAFRNVVREWLHERS